MRMASIERTAYPRFRRRPTAQELMDVYTPTPEAVAFARATARGPTATLTLVVLLKAFQRLGYFPRLQDVPSRCWLTSDRACGCRQTRPWT